MTIKTYSKAIDGKTKAIINCNKEGVYKLLIYTETDSTLIQSNNIILEKDCFTETSAKRALQRVIKSKLY